MSNAEFIEEYGKFEFRDMCKNISQDLVIAKAMKKIGGYKVSNKKKMVLFYKKDGSKIYLDFATIFTLGIDGLERKIMWQK